jgi:hypothetical protein
MQKETALERCWEEWRGAERVGFQKHRPEFIKHRDKQTPNEIQRAFAIQAQ